MRVGGETPACVLAVLLLLAAAAGPVAAPATAAPTRAPSEVLLLIVDSSGSMREPDGAGSTRMASARAALREIVTALPDSLDVGMRVYGHRVASADKAAACQDTELVVPVAQLERELLLGTIDRLQPLGETPIGLSLQQAAVDLPAGVPATVILVSDGEDECFPDLGPEPCAVTRDLVAQGVDLRLETIGLQVAPGGAEQLRCMAEAGGGQFTSVADAGLLAEAIAAAQNRSLRTFQVRGEAVSGGPSLIDATPLTPGTYTDGILDGETLWFAVDVGEDGEVTARWTVRTADVPTDAALALEWSDGAAERVAVEALDGIARGQATTLALATGPADSSRSPFGAAREPGRYYLSLRTAGFPPGVDHEFVLEILDGAADAATGTQAPLDPASTEPSASPTEDEPDDAAPPPPADVALPPPPEAGSGGGLVLVLLALLVTAAGGGLLLWRRRRAAADVPPAPTYY